jgi:hypothetical protein
MAKDDETGVDAVSADGAGATDDELEARRKKGNGGTSMAARAQAGEFDDTGAAPESEEDDGQGTFVWEQGRKVTLANIIARGTPTEHVFVFGGRRSRGSGGLMGFDAKPLMVVSGMPGPVTLVPTYDDEDKVTKVVVESHVRARNVANADSEEGLLMIAHLLEAHGYVKRDAAA